MQQVVKQAAELRANDISQPRLTRLRQQQRVEVEVGGVAVIVIAASIPGMLIRRRQQRLDFLPY